MSMIGCFLQLTPTELEALLSDPTTIDEFVYAEGAENENSTDVDKAWQAIHFMLTGTEYEGDPPLSNVVFSRTTIGDDFTGYGPARYLTAAEVLEVSQALQSLPPDEFATRYDTAALTASGIYPSIWDEDYALEYVTSSYKSLLEYYADAASRGNAILQYLG